MTTRYCLACGAELIRREGEKPSRFADRRTCDQKCGQRLGTTLRAKRHIFCPACGVKPKLPDLRHCGEDACKDVVNRGRPPLSHGWPEVTATDNLDFAAHNLPLRGLVTRLSGPELSYSPTGSSMGWASSRSGEGAA